MHDGQNIPRVVPVTNLREFFHDALRGALERQRTSVEDQTEHYVVNLLTLFARSDALYEQAPAGPGARAAGEAGRRAGQGTDRGKRLKPLVVMLTEALEAPSARDRYRALQRLGDVSLFVAGFFAQSFARKLIDIDYHIAMGGRAYGTLADSLAHGRGRVLGQVFAELAEKFQPMVDALNEVSEGSYGHSDRDILRLYEIWLKTGSPRSFRILKRLGVDPTPAARCGFTH
jgi:hypothetical protein